jgi:Zn-finger nucleic acid-binding protein
VINLNQLQLEENAMKCPRDNVEMNHRDLDSVVFEECPQCGGIWIQQEELRKAKDMADPDLGWMDFEIWQEEDRFQPQLSMLTCPEDNIPLVSVKYGETDIIIDYCPQSQGIWLDKGELEKIIQSLEHELEKMDTSEYVQASLNEAKELITGKESFASEWRDLMTVLRMFEYRALSEKPGLSKVLYAIQRTGLGLAGYNAT